MKNTPGFIDHYCTALICFALGLLLLVVCIGTGDWKTCYRPIVFFLAAFAQMARANRA